MLRGHGARPVRGVCTWVCDDRFGSGAMLFRYKGRMENYGGIEDEDMERTPPGLRITLGFALFFLPPSRPEEKSTEAGISIHTVFVRTPVISRLFALLRFSIFCSRKWRSHRGGNPEMVVGCWRSLSLNPNIPCLAQTAWWYLRFP